MSLRYRVRNIVDSQETDGGRIFDWFVVSLIVVSLVTFSIETLPNLPDQWVEGLQVVEIGIVSVFVVEYVLRLWVAKQRIRFVFSFYGMIDLIAILPALLATGMDFLSVRAFRLIRVVRLLKLVRYTSAVERFRRAIRRAKEELILFTGFTFVLLWISAVGIYYFENDAQPEHFASVFHSLWWALATLTTVGYGDIVPITVGGKIFTFVILLIGLSVVAVPAGIMSSALSRDIDRTVAEHKEGEDSQGT